MHAPDLSQVFRAEVVAARLEGALRADPDLAASWRAAAAVQEACASAWLEDLPVSAEALLCRGFRGMLGDPDRDRAMIAATAMLRGLHSPGDLLADTGPVLERIWLLAAGADKGTAPFDEEDQARVVQALRAAQSPILGAVAVARIVAQATEGRAPSAERLAFVAADHALRGSGRFMAGEAEPHELVAAPRGLWVVQPSVGLTDQGFRLWSVTNADRVGELLDGVARALDRSLGALALHRRWLDGLRARVAHVHGKSRLPDLAALLLTRPILTSGEVAERLSMSSRGALYLVERAEAEGLIAKITPRSTYRAWASVPLARMMGR